MYLRKKILKQGILATIALLLFLAMLQYCFYKEKAEEVFAETEKSSQSCFENVFLTGFGDTFQKIELFQVEEGSYYAFIPSEMRTDVYVEFDRFEELQVGGMVYHTGEELKDIYNPEPYHIQAKDRNGNVIEEADLHFYFSVNVPTLYIESDAGSLEQVNAEKGVKQGAGFSVVSETGSKDASGRCKIKARGNTSFQYDQKSYSINLEENQSVLGMASGSEWVLLANYKSTTHQLKNKIALDIAGKLGMQHTPESRFVNVYIDHQYNGLYLLTQKVSADGGAASAGAAAKGRGSIAGFYLMEFDARYENEPTWFRTERQKVVLKYPKNISHEQKDSIARYMQEAEDTIFAEEGRNPLTGKSYQEYLDIESWLNMYWMQEFFVQWDVEFSSFFLSKKIDDPHIYAGPVWDFDMTCGELYFGYYPGLTSRTLFLKDYKKGYLGRLGLYSEFQSGLIEKYQQQFAPAMQEYLEEDFEAIVNCIDSSTYMNSKRWGKGDTNMKTDTQELYAWLVNRKQFFDEYIQNSSLFNRVTFEFGWGALSYYVKTGDRLGFLPCEEYGEHVYSRSIEENFGPAIGWQNAEGESVDADMIISEDISLYPVYAE